MKQLHTAVTVSRRTALAGFGAGGLGLALAAPSRTVAAPVYFADLADHPMAGTWQVLANPMLPDAPQFPNVARLGADGSVLLVGPLSDVGPQGVVFTSSLMGTWEADDERTAHFTATQILSDANGASLGTVTVDGYPMASEDGQTFIDDGARVTVTIRDATGAVLQTIPPTTGGRPVTGTKMSPGNPGFPEGTPDAGTPAS